MDCDTFRYFGGCPEECVYDQTKLVVIKERPFKCEVQFGEINKRIVE